MSILTTNISRVHRILWQFDENFSTRTKQNIGAICKQFDRIYVPHLSGALLEGIQNNEFKKQKQLTYHAYRNYKTLCVVTHCATMLPPLYGLKVGCSTISQDGKTATALFLALQSDVALLEEGFASIKKAVESKKLSKIGASVTNKLRVLDNIVAGTTALLLALTKNVCFFDYICLLRIFCVSW